MGRYIKSNSVYTKRTRSQNIKNGTIYERDWTTLDHQKTRFGKGKNPLWSEGNFVYTTSSFPNYSKKSKTSNTFEEFTYNDVKDVKDVVNSVKLNNTTNDIRSFAYYGSCVDLVESSISHIIKYFPAIIYSNRTCLEYPIGAEDFVIFNEDTNKYEKYNVKPEEETDTGFNFMNFKGNNLYLIKNPFNIDILLSTIELNETDNRFRYMCESYRDYEIVFSGSEELVTEAIDEFYVEGALDKCKRNDEYYNYRAYQQYYDDQIPDADDKELKSPLKIKFLTEKQREVILYGWRMGESFVFLTKEKQPMVIKPKQEFVNEYFDNLNGFQKILLNTTSNPVYKNTFLTPVKNQSGYKLVNRDYVFPTIKIAVYDGNDNKIKDKYFNYFYECVDIESTAYDSFTEKLLNLATIYDETYSDNLYGRMTHEAIKNFDWTFTKDYLEGEEEDNVEGGLQMQRVLRLFGRIFDEAKSYADGIKNNNKVTYDGKQNAPDAIISDKVELSGWDVTSTVYKLENNDDDKLEDNEDRLDESFLKKYNLKWFNSVNSKSIDSAGCDVDFMRRLLLSSKRICSSKGTEESIDMIMGLFGLGRSILEYPINEENKVIIDGKTYDVDIKNNKAVINGKTYDVDIKNNKLIYDNSDYEVIEKYYETSVLPYDKHDDIVEVIKNLNGLIEEDEEYYRLPLKNLSISYDSVTIGDKNFKINKKALIDENNNEYLIEDDKVTIGNEVYNVDFVKRKLTKTTNEKDVYVFNINKDIVIIPCFDGKQHKPLDYYGHDFYFQDKGGWCKELNGYSLYNETIPYLKIIPKIEDLFNLSMQSIQEGDVFYVTDISDYASKFDTKNNITPSNFFYLDKYALTTAYPSQWHVISIDEYEDGSTIEAQKAKYLDSIISTNFGNNPHSGYGTYDDGEEFVSYMKDPFKYLIESNEINENGKKIVEDKGLNFDIKKISVGKKSDFEFEYSYRETYKLNSKIVEIINKQESTSYKEYFKNVILPYLLQVIPSTTILVLNGF